MLTRVPEEFLNVFRVASEKEVVFQLDSKKAAERMRFKFNKIRARMRKEDHPDLKSAERVSFLIRENVLVATPVVGDYMDEIAKALEPHKDVLKKIEQQEARDIASETASEAARLMEVQERADKMRKQSGRGQTQPSIEEILGRK